MALKTKPKVKKWGGGADKAKIEAAKRKLGDLKKKEGGGGGKDFDKLGEGKNVRRILPFTWAASGDFYVEVLTHFGVGPNNERCLCPTMHGGKCPLNRQADKLKAQAQKLPRNDKKRDALWREAKELWPRQQYAMLVLSVEPEEDLENPKILQVGPKVFKDILKYYTDAEEYGPITDLEEGSDIVIEKTKTGSKPTDVEYTVSLRSHEKSITVDESVMEKVTTSGPDLDKLYGEEAMPSVAEIEAMIEGVEYEEEDKDDKDDEEDEEDEEKASTKKKHPGRFQTKTEDDESESEEEAEEDEEEEESDSGGDDEEEEDEEASTKKKSLRDRLKDRARK